MVTLKGELLELEGEYCPWGECDYVWRESLMAEGRASGYSYRESGCTGGEVVIAGGRVAIARGRALHLPGEVWLKPKGERYEREEGESVVIVIGEMVTLKREWLLEEGEWLELEGRVVVSAGRVVIIGWRVLHLWGGGGGGGEGGVLLEREWL